MHPAASVDELLDRMSRTGFQGRKLGESYHIWKEMIETPNVTIILGLSGAMIPAGMQECLIQLVEHRFVDAIVSTGANIFHDVCEHLGVRHYRGDHLVNDAELYQQGIDRIYDVFAVEKEFQNVEQYIATFAQSLGSSRMSSRKFLSLLGEKILADRPKGRSLLAVCTKNNVPVHVPALADSAIGIGLVSAYRSGAELVIDQIADASELAAFVEDAERTGVIYLGGGTPKNFIQQTEVIPPRNGQEYIGGHAYAIQYTTDAPHWGGLSGCTFEEAVSWGKERPESKKIQCFCDITVALPLITSALITSGVVRN
ncbi:Deoxyhypusine synthase-like protein [Methanocorpusculaceae archaeon Ag1]|uniref:Deoxyhypusine synthase-like protein n=2 Tax=Methanorbis furvi TaxID=3028299 RepID=A0AAE4MFG6_9EURY|nr:Deoxyhypusine synthase-like protein [Methanocorpusculaceae archaeon Ag1]